MRRVLVVVGSLVVLAAIAIGVQRFTATDEITARPTSAPGSTSTVTTIADGAVVTTEGVPSSTTLATRDGTLDAALGAFLVTPAEYGAGFNPIGPVAEESTTRCGTVGIDDPAGSTGRAMIGMENTAGTLSVVQSVRAYPDPSIAGVVYTGAVAAINCPLIELDDGSSPTATGAEVPDLGADQAFAIDYFPDASTAAPTPIGGGFVARVGTRVLTLRYYLDPSDPAAVAYDLAAIVRVAIAKLAAG